MYTIWQLWSKKNCKIKKKKFFGTPYWTIGFDVWQRRRVSPNKKEVNKESEDSIMYSFFCKSSPFRIVDVNNVAILSKVGVYFRLLRPPSFPPSLNWPSATERGLYHFYLLSNNKHIFLLRSCRIKSAICRQNSDASQDPLLHCSKPPLQLRCIVFRICVCVFSPKCKLTKCSRKGASCPYFFLVVDDPITNLKSVESESILCLEGISTHLYVLLYISMGSSCCVFSMFS